MDTAEPSFAGNQNRFTGFADLYDEFRPTPPAVLAEILTDYCQPGAVRRVVDLGSGTGLATRYWAERVPEVIGIEPTADMRGCAERATPARNARYCEGWSHATGLPGASCDIVCCAQSLHWMEPTGTFREAKRILRAGGVFASTDFDWPPVVGSWVAEKAYAACSARVHELEVEQGTRAGLKFWEKSGHLARMSESGAFRYTREVVLHHTEAGNAERFVGVLLSQGSVQGLLKRGRTEKDLGLDVLREVAHRELGTERRDWKWSARVRLGVV